MKVRFSDTSLADLEDIGDWIARDDPIAAARMIADLRAAARQISQRPNLYPLANVGPDGLHRRLCRPYLIYYRVENGGIVIHAILHGARDQQRLLGDR